MSNKSSNEKMIIYPDNFTEFDSEEYIIQNIQLKIITSLMSNEPVSAQKIEAVPPTTEAQLVNKLNQIIPMQYDLLTPFIGYSKQTPHLLISKYQEKDILNQTSENLSDESNDEAEPDFLHSIFHQNSKEQTINWLNGTTKSIIALCVAKAMMMLHENNIIHQNLQPKTIKIIGESHLPHLIDYGLNEFRGKPSEASPHRYLAPELKKATDYSKKTDVFAFGVLLCELLQGKNYKKTTKQPPNIHLAPKKLRKLILQCLSQNPDDRPTFTEIYSQFKDHDTIFQDTDNEKLEKIIKALDEIEYKRNNTKFKPIVDITTDNLSDLYKFAKDVNPSNAENFFIIIGNKFDPNTNCKLFKALLNITLRFVQDPVYCKIFVKTQIHLNLPFDNERLYKQVFDIVYWIVQYEPDEIYSISEHLVYIMPNPKYTKKILVILTCYQQKVCYQKKFSVDHNLWKFLDQVLTSIFRTKNLKYQSNFISVYYTLCKNVPIFRKGRLKHCVRIFSSLIDSTNHSTIRAVYAFLSEYKDEQIPQEISSRFYDFTTKHLVNPHTALSAVKFLLIKSKFPIKKELVTSAIRLATISNLGNLLLCKIADNEKGANLLMKKLDFIELALPDLEGTLRVLLLLLRKKAYIDAYRESESLPFFLSNLAVNADLRVIKTIQNIFLILKIDSRFIIELEENNFCREFFDSLLEDGDGITMKNTLNLFIFFANKVPNLDFFKILIRKLKKQIIRINEDPKASMELLYTILVLFTLLSSIPNWIPYFKDFDVDKEFKSLRQNDPQIIEMKDSFKKNIDAYNFREQRFKKNNAIVNINSRSKSVPKSQKRKNTI